MWLIARVSIVQRRSFYDNRRCKLQISKPVITVGAYVQNPAVHERVGVILLHPSLLWFRVWFSTESPEITEDPAFGRWSWEIAELGDVWVDQIVSQLPNRKPDEPDEPGKPDEDALAEGKGLEDLLDTGGSNIDVSHCGSEN